MTLKIGKKLFGQDSLSEMKPVYEAVMALPGPTVLPVNLAQEYKPGSQILARQGEFAHVSLSETGGEVVEVGMKDASTCIGLYVFTPNDHCIIHIDHLGRKFNIDDIIDRFASKENIKAMVLGGSVANAGERGKSESNLTAACSMMISSKYPINLLSQKILNNNLEDDKSRQLKIKDCICWRLTLLYHHMFDHPIPQAWVSKLLAKDFSQNTPYTQDATMNLFWALFNIGALKDDKTEMALNFFNKIPGSSAQKFQGIVSAVFDKMTLEYANESYLDKANKEKLQDTELRTYGINVYDQKIRLLSILTPAPYESISKARHPDTFREASYLEIYRINQYIEPKLGKHSKNAAEKLDPAISRNSITEKEMEAAREALQSDDSSALADVFYSMKSNKSPLVLPLLISCYLLPKKTNNLIRSNEAVTKINELMRLGNIFQAHERAGQKNIIDAVTTKLSTDQSFYLLRQLGKNNIPAEIRADENKELHVCVFNIRNLKL